MKGVILLSVLVVLLSAVIISQLLVADCAAEDAADVVSVNECLCEELKSTGVPVCASLADVTRGGWLFQGERFSWRPDNCSIESRAPPPVSDWSNAVFLGDSTMAYLYNSFAKKFSAMSNITLDRVKQGKGCNVSSLYMGLPPPPIPQLDACERTLDRGPTAAGIQFKGCSDCNWCGPIFQGSAQGALQLEYLPVEFALDCTMQTIGSNATQKTVRMYLESKPKPVTHLVMSTGLHDMTYDWETYFPRNFRFYVNQMMKLKPQMITLVTSTDVYKDHTKWPQRRAGVIKLNKMMRQVFREVDLGDTKLRVLDAFQLSTGAGGIFLHKDNVHMKPEVYDIMADILMMDLL